MAAEKRMFSRREVLRAGALGAASLAAGELGATLAPARAEADVTQESPLAQGTYGLNTGWLFGGAYASGDEAPGASEAGYAAVTLPHTVTPLSWGNWNPASWENVWVYRLHLSQAALAGGRAFVDFQGVMTSATVWLNGVALGTHQGGYLPFSVELTEALTAGDNVLAVAVDATLQDVPPNNVVGGDAAIDYLQPGGIYRDVALRIVPEVYIADVFAQPVNVLTAPGLQVQVTVDSAVSARAVYLNVTLSGPSGQIATAAAQLPVNAGEPAQTTVSLPNLSGIELWSPESPTLYQVQVTASAAGGTHTFTVTTGFREAVFQTDGFYLNGARYQIFGLNRHQFFPYLGMAAPHRLQARDAALIKNTLGCNMVRCSHYPQSEWFLDACDALGLMVWQEPPGWDYVGDAAFRALVLQNVADMIQRDRNRPSVIVWATRLNETSTSSINQALYAQTDEIAALLDPSRQTTGAMVQDSTTGFNQQVFGYDDYHSLNNGQDATLAPPLPGVPYLVSEAVGALDGAPLYRWVDPQATLALQGWMHGQVHDIALSNPAYSGVLGWCAIDYQSLNGGSRIWNSMKFPGVTDTFRVSKPGAGLYASQQDPSVTPVIVPGFFWDFSSDLSPTSGPGSGALIFTNCDSLQLTIGTGKQAVTLTATPDTTDFPNLAHPPMLVDFPAVNGATLPPLQIEGIVDNQVVMTLNMSANTHQDRLLLTLDDTSINADGTDATRFTVAIVDLYGNHRPLPSDSTLQVTYALIGPGVLIADNPYGIGAFGGYGGGFIRSVAGATGTVTLTASCPGYPSASASLAAVAGASAVAPSGSGGTRVLNPPPVPAATGTSPLSRRSGSSAVTTLQIRAALHRLLAVRGAATRIARLLADGASLTFLAPEAGRLVIGWYRVTEIPIRPSASGHGTTEHSSHRRVRRVLVASATVRIHRSGRARVHVRLTARGRTLLRHAHRERLLAEATFTPARKGAHAVTELREIVLHR